MRKNIAAVALSTAALTLGLAGAAHAEQYGVDDPQDTYHGSDILSLQVRNMQDTLKITTHHSNLVRSPRSGSGGAFYIDTDPTDRGPEYVLAGGFFEGTDYLLSETEGFGPDKWGDPVENGDYIMRVDYQADTVRVKISQGTLGEPDEVRVAVRAAGTRTDGTSHGLVDWVGKPRSFSPWLARG
jgi:hypothetical protein